MAKPSCCKKFVSSKPLIQFLILRAWQVRSLIAGIARQASAHELIFVLLSGGGSALLPYPIDGLTLADKQTVTQLLLRSGATIQEINAVRRHLSELKGGKLARMADPAQVVTLILSDVIGDSLEDIASGPTAPDPSRYADCLEIIRKYRLQESIPAPARSILERGSQGEIAETVKPNDPVFTRVHNVIVGSNRLATEAARSYAESLGYRSDDSVKCRPRRKPRGCQATRRNVRESFD